MDSNSRIINLHEQKSIESFSERIQKFADQNIASDISEAVKTLRSYKETLELSPIQVHRIFENLQISDTHTPEEMNAKIINTHHSYILRKKFFDTKLSKKKFETTLLEIISELGRAISGDVLNAIVCLVKNFSLICLESHGLHTIYKELCFKFFCRDSQTNEILILIINLDYGLNQTSMSWFSRLWRYLRYGLHLSFFGAVVCTTLRE